MHNHLLRLLQLEMGIIFVNEIFRIRWWHSEKKTMNEQLGPWRETKKKNMVVKTYQKNKDKRFKQ